MGIRFQEVEGKCFDFHQEFGIQSRIAVELPSRASPLSIHHPSARRLRGNASCHMHRQSPTDDACLVLRPPMGNQICVNAVVGAVKFYAAILVRDLIFR